MGGSAVWQKLKLDPAYGEVSPMLLGNVGVHLNLSKNGQASWMQVGGARDACKTIVFEIGYLIGTHLTQ